MDGDNCMLLCYYRYRSVNGWKAFTLRQRRKGFCLVFTGNLLYVKFITSMSLGASDLLRWKGGQESDPSLSVRLRLDKITFNSTFHLKFLLSLITSTSRTRQTLHIHSSQPQRNQNGWPDATSQQTREREAKVRILLRLTRLESETAEQKHLCRLERRRDAQETTDWDGECQPSGNWCWIWQFCI
jgi:hypothetical protein